MLVSLNCSGHARSIGEEKKLSQEKMKSRELETVIHLVQTPKLVVWGEEVGG